MSGPVTSDHLGGSMTTDERIIDATLSLISEHGLGGVTMSRVAEFAGVARQTLYNHYGDVDSIAATAIDRHNRESLDLLEAGLRVAESPADKIEQIVRHFVMVGSHAQHVFDFGMSLSADVRTAIDTYQTAVEQHIGDIIEEGLKRGDFRSDLDRDIDTVLTRTLLEGISDLAADAPEQAPHIATTGTRTLLAALQ